MGLLGNFKWSRVIVNVVGYNCAFVQYECKDWRLECRGDTGETNEKQNLSLSLLLIWFNYSLMLV